MEFSQRAQAFDSGIQNQEPNREEREVMVGENKLQKIDNRQRVAESWALR